MSTATAFLRLDVMCVISATQKKGKRREVVKALLLKKHWVSATVVCVCVRGWRVHNFMTMAGHRGRHARADGALSTPAAVTRSQQLRLPARGETRCSRPPRLRRALPLVFQLSRSALREPQWQPPAHSTRGAWPAHQPAGESLSPRAHCDF